MQTKCTWLIVTLCGLAPGPVLADDVADVLKSCQLAFSDIPSGTQLVGLSRKEDGWRVVSVSVSDWPDGFDVGRLSRLPSLESIEFGTAAKDHASVKGGSALVSLQELRRIRIWPWAMTDELFGAVAQVPKLEELDLGTLQIGNGKPLIALRPLPRLKRLNLEGIGLQDGQIDCIAAMKDLESLNLCRNPALSEQSFTVFMHLKELRDLALPTPGGTSDFGLNAIKPLARLRTLRMSVIGASGIRILAELPELESLRCVVANDLNRADLSVLSKLKSLEIHGVEGKKLSLPKSIHELCVDPSAIPELDLQSCRHLEIAHVDCDFEDKRPEANRREVFASLKASPALTDLKMSNARDSDVQAVGGLKMLRVLELRAFCAPWESLGDQGVKALDGLHELRSFSSNSYQVTDGGMAVLKQFSNLRKLEMHIGPEVTDAGLANIWRLQRLQQLRLEFAPPFCNSLDDILARVGKLEHLEELCIPGTLTDAGLMQLVRLKKLRRLVLTRNAGFTDDALASLMRALPQLSHVLRSYNLR